MEDLEREIIEISTKLGALAPDLRAAAELRIDFAGLKKEAEMSRREYDKALAGVSERMSEGDRTFRDLELRVQACEQQADNLERTIEEKIKTLQKDLDEKIKTLQENQAGSGKKIWELVQLFLSAAVGGLVSYYIARGKP